MARGENWEHALAPSLGDFEELALRAWRRLPRHFRELCRDLVIRIEEFPTEEVLEELKLDSPFDLMGLYQGVSLPNRSVSDVLRLPDMVFLYRRPILDHWSEGGETLGHLVTHVLVHEIGHHFGLSDASMREVEEGVGD
jgi:predicted Zn-dependent protease with MMP-like domain